jgi:hypothetical protein
MPIVYFFPNGENADSAVPKRPVTPARAEFAEAICAL